MLKRLDLSNNLLEKSRNYNNLNVLAALSSLQDLRLVGNKGLKTYKTVCRFSMFCAVVS